MRLILLAPLLTCALAVSGAAWAQSAPDGPVASAGSKAGGAPTDPGPVEIHQTPPAPAGRPAPDPRDFEAAAEAGHRAPLLGEYHGQVGAVVGTNGLRGAYGHLNAHPSDHVTLDLRFSTLHANGYPYGGGFGYGPGLYVDPLSARPVRRGPDGWSTEVLGADQDGGAGEPAGSH